MLLACCALLVSAEDEWLELRPSKYGKTPTTAQWGKKPTAAPTDPPTEPVTMEYDGQILRAIAENKTKAKPSAQGEAVSTLTKLCILVSQLSGSSSESNSNSGSLQTAVREKIGESPSHVVAW